MSLLSVIKNPLVLAFGKSLLGVVVNLIKSEAVPRVQRVAFEEMSDKMKQFSEYVLEQKEKVEKSETKVDDAAYNVTKEAFKKFLDEANTLYNKM